MAIDVEKHRPSVNKVNNTVSIILDNQSVIRDLSALFFFFPSCSTRQFPIFSAPHFLSLFLPFARITIRWCPGQIGFEGSAIRDELAKQVVSLPLPPSPAVTY